MWHKGRAWFIGDDIDTDQIMPTRYLALRTPEDLGPHALSGNDPAWSQRIARGDILVAGKNFGCGSSREHAPLGLKGMGLACVVAKSSWTVPCTTATRLPSRSSKPLIGEPFGTSRPR